ncbi:MAG TPA: STAS domain-containing protein [Solimonas sp.]|nr:STAS domain-containing protein [Solimonas sp.]
MSAAPRLEGELTLATVGAWLDRASSLSGAGTCDLSGVTRVDSAGLAFLLELQRRSGKSLRYTGAPSGLRRLAEFFGLVTLLGLE